MEENKNNVIDTGTEEIDEQIYYQVLNKIKENKINHSNNNYPKISKLCTLFLEENADLSVEETFSVQNLKKYKLFLQDAEENSSEKISLSESMKYAMYLYRLSVFDDVLKKVKEENNKQLETHVSKMPDKFTFLTSKLVRELPKDFINMGTQQIKIIDNGNKSIINAELKNDLISLPDGYTLFDLFVNFAAISCWKTGDDFITPVKLYKTMTGKINEKINLTDDIKRQIENSLTKNATTWITIDYEAQLKYYPIEGDYTPLAGNLLNLQKQKRIVNGKESEGYKIIYTPVLYEYSLITNNQMANVPMHYLNTKPKNGSDITYKPNVITIKLYITNRIRQVKYSNGKFKNKILYETMFNDCNITYDNNKQRLKYIAATRKILDGLKMNGYIKSYEETTGEKRLLTGFTFKY